MPNYRRLRRCGGTYFLTVVTHRRRRILADALARRCLHRAIDHAREHWPFTIRELVLLPDHFHIILTMPDGVDDFSTRIGRIKSKFTELYLDAGGEEAAQSALRDARGLRGIWQKRFWEHLVRDINDLGECTKYVWYNPIEARLGEVPA